MDEQLLKEINPVFLTARSSVYRYASFGNETAKQIVAFLEKDRPKERFMQVPERITDPVRKIFVSILEARYGTMEQILDDEAPALLLDIPCGYTMRPIEYARRGIRYVGADLPATIADMGEAVDALLSEDEKRFVTMTSADATNPDSVKAALKGISGPVCITTEGLLSYFTDSETEAMFETVRSVLSERGGCWITPDREIGDYIRITAGIVANGDKETMERFIQQRKEISRLSKSNVNTNTFMTLPLEESIKWAEQRGFKVERLNMGKYLPDLTSLSDLREGLMDELREACMELCVWRLTLTDREKKKSRSSEFSINAHNAAGVLTVSISGRLDTLTAPRLVTVFEEESAKREVQRVCIDLADLDYISSAGLRSLLIIRKRLGSKERLSVINISQSVMEIFETTGFAELLL
ncbi:MAG: STAS domain-containing protein [Ruminococcus sp.]|nr:STAS domain-containing protein [Ruminococcus sp.]